ncbi:class I SAM-dependent methyltransferase [Thalassococcus sp. BH17M4-6]|uniref:class I SAM-dependent methyltransferase n=1 Tax=Thalassococcus sp. BH17M4-6 TaxID=3413148 RepID=UPI003BED976A
MTLPDGFLELYTDLHRQGPGLPADVVWALNESGLSGPLRVLDAGAGSGADSETLAQALPEARIDAVEGVAQFVSEAQARLHTFGPRVTAREGDMAQVEGPYDLIWCAGALYFLGVTEGLQGWADALAPGGWVAFSEPVYLSDPPSEAARAFWEGEGAVGDIDSIRARVAAAGYAVRAERLITGEAWAAYYDPLAARIAELKAAGRAEALAEVIEASEAEIARWKAAPDEIAYVLMLVQPE